MMMTHHVPAAALHAWHMAFGRATSTVGRTSGAGASLLKALPACSAPSPLHHNLYLSLTDAAAALLGCMYVRPRAMAMAQVALSLARRLEAERRAGGWGDEAGAQVT